MVFMFISNLCSPLFVFKRGFLGSLFIVFVKVIIWVNCRLVHCWAGGRHLFSFERVDPFSSYQVLGCWVGLLVCRRFAMFSSYSTSSTDVPPGCPESALSAR